MQLADIAKKRLSPFSFAPSPFDDFADMEDNLTNSNTKRIINRFVFLVNQGGGKSTQALVSNFGTG